MLKAMVCDFTVALSLKPVGSSQGWESEQLTIWQDVVHILMVMQWFWNIYLQPKKEIILVQSQSIYLFTVL